LFQIHYISDLSLIISFMIAGIKKKSAKRAEKKEDNFVEEVMAQAQD